MSKVSLVLVYGLIASLVAPLGSAQALAGSGAVGPVGMTPGKTYTTGRAQLKVISAEECTAKPVRFAYAEQAVSDSEIYSDADGEGTMSFATYLAAQPEMSCKKKNEALNALAVTNVVFAGSAFLACTGAGVFLSIFGALGTFATGILTVAVSNIECKDPLDDKAAAMETKRVVCETMLKNGYECDPNRI